MTRKQIVRAALTMASHDPSIAIVDVEQFDADEHCEECDEYIVEPPPSHCDDWQHKAVALQCCCNILAAAVEDTFAENAD